VFVDIEPHSLTHRRRQDRGGDHFRDDGDPRGHCYGHPCDVDAIQKIADNYNLRVIYDAAHAFGVRHGSGSLLTHGDLSVLSFHATKVFNTFEGGAIVCPTAKIKLRIDQLKNFGFVDETTVVAAGINGKMAEVNAALGLLQLKHIHHALARREVIDARYRAALRDVAGIRCIDAGPPGEANHAYFPILVGADYPLSRDGLYDKMRARGINPRRYFYPLISSFAMYRTFPSAHPSNLPVATAMAQEILCLPIYPDLADEQVDRVADLIARP
jgi:dTDP-4-amino-4,6-dideoxygalactose transaminase